jgi:hypothetical protein
MLSVIRPDFEVVKEGQILHFISGYRKFKVDNKRLILVGTPFDLFQEP